MPAGMARGVLIAVVVALAAVGAAAAAGRGGAPAGPSAGEPAAAQGRGADRGRGAPARAAGPAAVTLLTRSQRAAAGGVLRVRVRSRRAGALWVAATARRARRGARVTRITTARRIRLRPGRTATVRLRLTRGGRRALARCQPTRLSAFAAARRAGRSGGPGVWGRSRSRRLALDSAACSRRGGGGPGGGSGSGGGGSAGGGGSGGGPAPLGPVSTANADRCDFLDPSVCLYPWPNDHFTRADAGPTGRRLDIERESMPANRFGVHIDPSDQNRADGFSPGNMIVTRVPGLDSPAAFERTGAVPITDMARSFDAEQPVVVLNARTLQRQLIWAEVDSNPANPADRTLIVRPGRNFDEGERYIVALRNLKDAEGRTLAPREEFRAYRDGLDSGDPALEARRAHFEGIFAKLGQAGIERSSLYLAWDFTVASRQSLTDRALSIRDDAFAQLGDTDLSDRQVPPGSTAPAFVPNPDVPDSLEDENDGRRDLTAAESSTTARRITGRLVVPCYLGAPGCPPGSSFNLGADGKPVRTPGNTAEANVICTVPRRALDGPTPEQVRLSLYGHGLLGSAGEVGAGNVQRMGQEHGYVFCATDWAGMSTADVPNVVTLLQDLSNFKSLADRIQQGYVNFMYLGRWLLHPAGAAAHPYFAGVSMDRQALFYDGNSQGGILSGGLTALTPDFKRAVHGVPGMNYSTLLRRSVDFDMYANGDVGGPVSTGAGLYDNYPNELERPLILSAIQLLWDRGESNGYAHHMTSDPLPDTPTHEVLLHTAFGDHQVADVTTEVEARTIGASVHRPLLAGHRPRYLGRPPAESPFSSVGLPSLPLAGGHDGSALVFWDVGPLRDGGARGTPPPPPGNVPPREGNDPHGAPRNDPEARRQKALFMRVGGTVEDVCGGGPCFADGYGGAP